MKGVFIVICALFYIFLLGAVPAKKKPEFTGITYAEGYLYAITEKGAIYKERYKEGLGGYAPKMEEWELVGNVLKPD